MRTKNFPGRKQKRRLKAIVRLQHIIFFYSSKREEAKKRKDKDAISMWNLKASIIKETIKNTELKLIDSPRDKRTKINRTKAGG